MISTLLWLCVVGVAVYLVFWVFFPLGRGAIYDPSSPDKTNHIADMAEIVPGDKAADLGSGDGRVVIALARRGAEAHGYEINPLLVLRSRRNIREAGLDGKAFIHWGSFWRADFSPYSVITVFQVGFVMGRLEEKCRRELSPRARIVSHHWRFPHLTSKRMRGDVYVYMMDKPGG
jgi:cyclopropane fatty-acyl-phospholipid synthase-like methyltransferase